MRVLLLVALAGLVLAPLAAPPAVATRCAFVVEELQGPVCAAVLFVICAGQTVAAGGHVKECLPRLP